MSNGQGGVEPSQPTTIWQELDTWAKSFKPWQRFVLANAVRFGRLTDHQIEQAYALFLHEHALSAPPDPAIEVPETITGRPTSATPAPLWLTRIGDLSAINALPSAAELTFSSGLTVIYGGNGVGKSGFTRVLSNACFSRMQHKILPNIYQKMDAGTQPAANITVADGNQGRTTFAFNGNTEFPELKRIAVFDSAVAQTHLVDQSPLGFKPAGFDIFPEMARAYGQLGSRLTADIERRSRENIFVKSFVAPESSISKLIASLDAGTNLEELRKLGVFGAAEAARLEEIQHQISELQSKSAGRAIAQLQEAKNDLTTLAQRINDISALLTHDACATYRAQLADFASKTKEVAHSGAESFKTALFKGIGSAEWENFLTAAHALARIEDANYPRDDDHCLLCHRPLDEASITLIRRFWEFLVSDARRKAETARATLDKTAGRLKALRLDFFSAETAVRAHLRRINPDLANQIDKLVSVLDGNRKAIISVLEAGAGEIALKQFPSVSSALAAQVAQIESDIARLQKKSIDDALKALEAERVALRHRQVLAQLLPEIEMFVADLLWVRTASGVPRRELNPRPLTDKETNLFATVIAEKYRARFAEECLGLDCGLPVEFKTHGQRGQTVRSLSMKGGHSPCEILSEGEQRAVALADFLTEVNLNPANAGIVLDDPVTSQDHERKELIANRLVSEARTRQVVIFTHDLVFLTMLAGAADNSHVDVLTHWVEKDSAGNPGQISLDDSPASTPQYRNTRKAQKTLEEANIATGSKRVKLIQRGLAELRRTIEEIVPHFLFKQVVNRWTDRIIVTGLKKVSWDDKLIADLIHAYEDISAYIEGHSHTEVRAGAPPDISLLEKTIPRVDDLIKRARAEKTV